MKTSEGRQPLGRRWSAGIILAVLYLPQSWFFLMDYAWNSYRLQWLKFLPGLPAFCPMAIIAHPNEMLMVTCTLVATVIVAAALYFVSRRSLLLFGIVSAIAFGMSSLSAVVAYAAFRA